MVEFKIGYLWALFFLIFACGHSPEISHIGDESSLNKQFEEYWYDGQAELSSYELAQARYGEIRKGHSVLVFVTEDFLPKEQVKADTYSKANIPVLKLNATKKFNTGIYPYSIMQSVFYPVGNTSHAVKVSSSMQEWCGHTYVQLNNRKQYEIESHSYFEGEADQVYTLDKNVLENELWTKLRIDPLSLPTGKINVIPSFEFCRMKHVELKPYPAELKFEKSHGNFVYTISYPSLDRELTIQFQMEFPYLVESWTDTYVSGFGKDAHKMSSTGKRITTMKSKYWSQHDNKHEILRDSLGITNE